MYFKIFVLAFGIFTIFLIVLEAKHSYENRMFNVEQMIRLHGPDFKGLPFTAHGAMRGDLLIITPCLICILAFYGKQWTLVQWLTCGSVGYALNIIMHIFYARNSGAIGAEPDCIVQNGELTSAGWFHFIFMGNGLAVVLLFYFATPKIDPAFLWAITFLFIAHLFVANNVHLSLANPPWWTPRPHRDPKVWVQIIVGSAVLLYRTRTLLIS